MASESEAAFQAKVIALATHTGWLVHAERPARSDKGWRTPIQGMAGWPDVVLVRDGVMLIAELKAQRGRVTPEQRRWLDALEAVPGIIVRCWRPADWDEIHATLARKQQAKPSARLV